MKHLLIMYIIILSRSILRGGSEYTRAVLCHTCSRRLIVFSVPRVWSTRLIRRVDASYLKPWRLPEVSRQLRKHPLFLSPVRIMTFSLHFRSSCSFWPHAVLGCAAERVESDVPSQPSETVPSGGSGGRRRGASGETSRGNRFWWPKEGHFVEIYK